MENPITRLSTSGKIKLLRYDWISLLVAAKGDRILATRVLIHLFCPEYKIKTNRVMEAARLYLASITNTNNFVVEGKDILRMCKAHDVPLKYLAQLFELAAYRDLFTFNKTMDNRLEKLLVLDILENMEDLASNPLIKETEDYILFTCEHLK